MSHKVKFRCCETCRHHREEFVFPAGSPKRHTEEHPYCDALDFRMSEACGFCDLYEDAKAVAP